MTRPKICDIIITEREVREMKKNTVELKGVKALDKVFTAMLKGFGISRATMGTSYAYWWQTEEITYQVVHGIEDNWFDEFVYQRFHLKIHPMVLSLLHEVGHHYTLDDVEGSLNDFCESEKERITKDMARVKSERAKKRIEWEYFNLPDEIIATHWAVAYARKHPFQVKRMTKVCEKAMKKFYKVNNVVDDCKRG